MATETPALKSALCESKAANILGNQTEVHQNMLCKKKTCINKMKWDQFK